MDTDWNLVVVSRISHRTATLAVHSGAASGSAPSEDYETPFSSLLHLASYALLPRLVVLPVTSPAANAPAHSLSPAAASSRRAAATLEGPRAFCPFRNGVFSFFVVHRWSVRRSAPVRVRSPAILTSAMAEVQSRRHAMGPGRGERGGALQRARRATSKASRDANNHSG